MSLKTAKKKAWEACSKYIRLKYSRNGQCTCVTCGVTKPIKDMQAGHAVGGRGSAVLFEEKLIHPQCYRCNCILGGNYGEYALFMIDTYGRKEFDRLRALKQKTIKRSELDFLDIEKEFLRKIEVLHAG